MSELEIPERASKLFYTPHDCFTVGLAAPIIMAAELRQLADDPLADSPKIDNWTSGEVSAWLRRRADELDPEGSAS